MATNYIDTNDIQVLVYPVGTSGVTAGRLLATENSTTRAVVHASAGGARCVGVADHDAAAGSGVTVLKNRACVVTASGTVGAGDRLVPTGAGLAAAAGATPDARTIVGYALEPAANGQTFGAYIW